MIEEASVSNSQANADNDSLRRKLRDSLTSALAMVVSKELVKRVLGKAVNIEVAEEKLVMQLRCKTEGYVTLDRSTVDIATMKLPDGEVHHLSDSMPVVNMLVDGGFEATVDETQGRVFMGSTSAQSGRCDYHPDLVESPLEDFEKEATVEAVEEVKSGIQLMEQAREVAWNVELNLFSLSGGVNKKYKEKARSLLFNLKDKSNPELRARVFRGDINPEILVSMSAAELASRELCQWRIAKAEEFASMVVLTEADVDSRRVVKKTHKGEFQVVVGDTGLVAGAESTNARPAFPANDTGGTEVKGGDPVSASTCQGGVLREFSSIFQGEDCQVDPHAPSEIYVLHGTVEDESMETEEPVNDVVNNLMPSVMSMDEDTEGHLGSETEVPSHSNSSVQHGEMKAVSALGPECSRDEMWTSVLPSLSDADTRKHFESPSTFFSGPEGGNRVGFSNCMLGNSEFPVWEGSLQLSASRSVSIGGFYKSGVKLQVTDWPQSVEVKGRVRLGVLDKFLRDLQLSRSRTVTVLSLCPSDAQSKRTGTCLKEIAEHYRMGDRAGFAEPKPGFELYLLAPGTACLDLRREDRTTIKMALKREDEALVGVVVWRKSQSQGLSSSREPEQTSCIRKVTTSSLLCASATTGSAQALHGKETLSCRAGVSPSLEAVSALSLVNVSGNTSMQSTQSSDGSSDARDSQNPGDYEHARPASSGFYYSPLMVAQSRVPKTGHSAMANSCLRPEQSRDFGDHPPGFKTFVPYGPTVVTGQTTKHLQDFQESPVSAGHVPGALVSDGKMEVSTKGSPAFWPKSPAEFPAGATPKIQTVSQQYDDDLPEFNFDAEDEANWKPADQVIRTRKTLCLTGRDNSGVFQPFSRLQHISDPTNSYGGHNDIRLHHSSSVEFQSMVNGLPSRRLIQQGESSASSPSVSLFPSNEGWNNVVCAREPARTVAQQNNSRTIFLSNSTDHRNPSKVWTEDLTTHEKLWDTDHHSTEVLGHFNSKPSGFTSSAATISNGAGHTVVCNNFFPRNSLPPIITHLGWPGLSPTQSGYPQHNSQQPSLLNLVIEHRQIELKEHVSTAERLPLRYQEETIRHDWPAICANNPSYSSSANPKQVHSMSKRKMESMDGTFDMVRVSEFYVKDARCISSHSGPRSFGLEPKSSSSGERGWKRWGQSVCPGRGRSFLSSVRGDTEQSDEIHVVKPPKRERERDQ